jgi:hypothetical protein
MTPRLILFSVFAASTFLEACSITSLSSHRLEQLDPYHAALVTGFEKLAEEKRQSFDWSDASLYEEKASTASKGLPPGDPLANRNIPTEMKDVTWEQAKRLSIAQTMGSSSRSPAETAQARLLLEQWLERLEAGDATASTIFQSAFQKQVLNLETTLGLKRQN